MKISVCIATYRRADRLAALLGDLACQKRLPSEVIVVDNDPDSSALSAVENARRDGAPFPLIYAMQPVKNISKTRNRTVELASGEWMAFVDDDERVSPRWLDQLLDAAMRTGADGVLGPVVPVVPSDAPEWIRRGNFYDWVRMKSGSVVPLNRLRFGNVLLRGSLLRNGVAFDPAYGLTGGEDGDLLTRLSRRGARIVWCDEAQANEPIEPARLSTRWLLLRALRGGQDFARHSLAGRYGPFTLTRRFAFNLRAAIQAFAALALALLLWPLGRHHAVHWLSKASANIGKLSILWGWHYREYA